MRTLLKEGTVLMAIRPKFAIREFTEVLQRYCALIEHHNVCDPAEFLRSCQTLLVELYQKALNLPEVNQEGPFTQEKFSFESYAELRCSLSEFLGKWNLYYEIIDPYEYNNPVPVCLSDDLIHIYRDLTEGFKAANEGGNPISIRHAVWEWRFSFFTHWGAHLVSVLRPLHRILEDD